MLNKLHIADMNTCNKLNAKLEYLDAFPRNFTPPCFSVTQDSVTYAYVIEHKDSFLIVNIESSVEASYEILWNRAVVLLKLYKLLRGYFPEFKSLSFYLKVNDNKEIKINLNDKCLHNMMHRYTTEEGTLRACLRQAISSYGNDIFEKEYKTKQPDDFHKLLVESRNRVFHVDGSKQNILQDIEYTAYNMKLSILYRRIMTAKILPEFKFSTDVQRYYIKLIDKWVDQNSK